MSHLSLVTGVTAVFQGTSLITLDAKGRLLMPVRHREALLALCNGEITLTRHPDGCVLIYPRAIWEEKKAVLSKLPYSARVLQRIVLGGAVNLVLDRVGRFLVPEELRGLCELEKDVALIGLGMHFELWRREKLEALEVQSLAAGLAPEAADFSF